MFILDTNIVSALMLPVVPREVAAWFASQSPQDVFTTAITQAEIALGIARLPAGRRRDQLAASARLLWEEHFETRVLEFDPAAATAISECATLRRAAQLPLSTIDIMIAAIGRLHNATIVTRNARDFEHCGVRLLDPWAPATS